VRRGVIKGWPVRADVVEQSEAAEQPAISDPTAATLEDLRATGPPLGPPSEVPNERDLWPWLLALLVLVLVGIAVVYFATRDDTNTQHHASTTAPAPSTVPTSSTTPTGRVPSPSEQVTVPRLVGLAAPVALARLRQIGLAGATQNVFSKKPANVVVAHAPGAPRKAAKGDTVMLKVSKGPGSAAVPDIVGQSLRDALRTLHAQSFKSRVVRVPSVEPAGQVVAQHPRAGAKARSGTGIRLNVSAGNRSAPIGKVGVPVTTTTTKDESDASATRPSPPSPSPVVRVPDLVGANLRDARRIVRRIGLVIEIRRVPNAQPLGSVIAQAKEPGTEVKRGTHLLITVSRGREPLTATNPSQGSQPSATPDVVGQDEVSATQDLENAGFTVQVVDRDTTDASEDGIVIEQNPAANQSVRRNSTVTIYVGRYTSP
jgi:eukaryotic-like serine/threonine-protein kinase